jgi:hypothetical protein
MAKNTKNGNYQSDASIDRKLAAAEMNKIFTLGSVSKKENANRWSKERRTEYNEKVVMIQYLFDSGAYSQVKQWLGWLDSEQHITGRKYEQNTPQGGSSNNSKERKKRK